MRKGIGTVSGLLSTMAVIVGVLGGLAAPPSETLAAAKDSFDGAWVGKANLECDNMGDPRPPIQVSAEFTVEGKELKAPGPRRMASAMR